MNENRTVAASQWAPGVNGIVYCNHNIWGAWVRACGEAPGPQSSVPRWRGLGWLLESKSLESMSAPNMPEQFAVAGCVVCGLSDL